MGSSPEQPILIVGAGPVGLTAALALCRSGIPVRIVDKQAAPSIHSKAMTLQPRTLELLHHLRVAQPMIEQGIAVSRANMYCGTRRLVQLRLDKLDSPFPFILQLPQSTIEQLLIQSLLAYGVRVERCTTLVGIMQTPIVQAQLEQAAGASHTAEAAYLIGCDGAQSTVRTQLGIPFKGSKYRENFIMADVEIKDFPLAPTERHTFLGKGLYFVILPIAGNYYRLITMRRPDAPDAEQEPTLEEFEQIMSNLGAPKMSLSSPQWLTQFCPRRHLAQTFRSGHVFLAGDAAHIHSPVGAQGLNTGVQDAINLAWKLIHVLRHWARPELLDSYHTERHAIAQAVLRQTDAMLGAIANTTRWGGFVERNKWYVYRYPALNYRQANANAQLRVSYRAVIDETTYLSESEQQQNRLYFSHALAVGDRAPDFVDGKDLDRRFFDCFDGLTYQALFFSGYRYVTEQAAVMQELAQWIHGRYNGLFRLHAILIRPQQLPETMTVWMDTASSIHRRYGVKRAGLYLIRPDGYIAARLPLAQKLLDKCAEMQIGLTKVPRVAVVSGVLAQELQQPARNLGQPGQYRNGDSDGSI